MEEGTALQLCSAGALVPDCAPEKCREDSKSDCQVVTEGVNKANLLLSCDLVASPPSEFKQTSLRQHVCEASCEPSQKLIIA